MELGDFLNKSYKNDSLIGYELYSEFQANNNI